RPLYLGRDYRRDPELADRLQRGQYAEPVRLLRGGHAVPPNRACPSTNPARAPQSWRHRYLAGDPDPLPALYPPPPSPRLALATGRHVRCLNELLRHTRDGVMLPVRLTPKSARDEIAGIENFGGETVLEARVGELQEQGRANEALEQLVAAWLKLPPSSVKVA